MPTQLSDLDIALKSIRAGMDGYNVYAAYQQGNQRLSFATEKFTNAFGSLFREFADNLCGSIVDAPADRLVVTGFSVEDDGKGQGKQGKKLATTAGANDPTDPGERAWRMWLQNRMPQRAGETHQTALGLGDAYVIVWPGADGKPRVYVNDPRGIFVRYDEEDPGTILWAAKAWVTHDRFKRVNVYYPDRIEKYVSEKVGTDSTLPTDSKRLVEYQAKGETWPLKNKWGVVPVFHFANNAPIGQFGTSELKPVIPLQDALNKSVMDMLVAMEFVAFPQRWMTGVEITIDPITSQPVAPFNPGVERIWATQNADVKFGEFAAADLSNFLNVSQDFRVEIARVSGTPLHYMGLPDSTGRAISGEALKVMESRFVKKIKDRQEAWGDVWEAVMSFCMRISSEDGADARLSAEWADAAPSSEMEKMQMADLMINKVGLDHEYTWARINIPQSEIDRMLLAKEQAKADMSALQQAPAVAPGASGAQLGQDTGVPATVGQNGNGKGPVPPQFAK